MKPLAIVAFAIIIGVGSNAFAQTKDPGHSLLPQRDPGQSSPLAKDPGQQFPLAKLG